MADLGVRVGVARPIGRVFVEPPCCGGISWCVWRQTEKTVAVCIAKAASRSLAQCIARMVREADRG